MSKGFMTSVMCRLHTTVMLWCGLLMAALTAPASAQQVIQVPAAAERSRQLSPARRARSLLSCTAPAMTMSRSQGMT